MIRTVMMPGTVIKRNFCQGDAPSTSAASYSSDGIACSAASSETPKNGKPCQIFVAVTAISAVDALPNHAIGTSMMPSLVRMKLNTPEVPSYIQRQVSAVTNVGATQGSNSQPRNIVRILMR